MNNIKINKIIYIITNILFIFATIACIYLYPNMLETGLLGKIFLITYIIHGIFNIGLFLLKNDKEENDILQNLVSSFLYIYLILIAFRYVSSTNNLIYDVNTLYFKINYIISSISMVAITFNKILNKLT